MTDTERAKRNAVRVAELEGAIREMIAAIPDSRGYDPQDVADAMCAIAARHGVHAERRTT